MLAHWYYQYMRLDCSECLGNHAKMWPWMYWPGCVQHNVITMICRVLLRSHYFQNCEHYTRTGRPMQYNAIFCNVASILLRYYSIDNYWNESRISTLSASLVKTGWKLRFVVLQRNWFDPVFGLWIATSPSLGEIEKWSLLWYRGKSKWMDRHYLPVVSPQWGTI